jgi:short-subunit dehydrogenase
MSKNLKGKIVLLTGAGGGLGQEFTRQLIEEGAQLILTDVDEKKLKETSDKISASIKNPEGKILKVIGADISTDEGCKSLYNKSIEVSKNLDCIIFNAGMLLYGDFQDVPKEKWEALMAVNLLAPMRLTYLFLPDMLARREGHLVYISSIAGVIGTTQSTTYSASKFGLRGFALSLAEEIKNKGIDVTVVYPFWINTSLLKMQAYGTQTPKTLKYIYIYTPKKIINIILKSVKKRKRQVFPGIIPKIINFLNKFYTVVGSQRIKGQ